MLGVWVHEDAEYEWVIAETEADALEVILAFVGDEQREFYDSDGLWRRLGDDETFTMRITQDDLGVNLRTPPFEAEITAPVKEWVEYHGRGFLASTCY